MGPVRSLSLASAAAGREQEEGLSDVYPRSHQALHTEKLLAAREAVEPEHSSKTLRDLHYECG